MGLSIADKLRNYISENGGDPAGAQTIAELVDKLPEGGGSGSVFEVALTGSWTEGSDDDSPVVPGNKSLEEMIFYNDDEYDSRVVRSDKTFEEIIEAYNNGLTIRARWYYDFTGEGSSQESVLIPGSVLDLDYILTEALNEYYPPEIGFLKTGCFQHPSSGQDYLVTVYINMYPTNIGDGLRDEFSTSMYRLSGITYDS